MNLSFLLLFIQLITSIHFSSTSSENAVTDIAKIKALSKEAKSFCLSKNMNTDFFILIDLKIHSGKNRFYVWDFKQDKIIYSFLVSHGCCDNTWGSDESKNNPRTSNVDGSHCSSVGKYKIGDRGYSNWGINVKYLMHGLESTNSNAMRRQIVFHSWNQVSDTEIYPKGTPEGWGCPAVSNSAMKIIDPMLRNANKKVLMWIVK